MQSLQFSTDDGYQIIIPSLFNGYNIIKMLNKGQYSVVALVEEIQSHQNFAAKIISKKDMKNKQEINLKLNEIKILRTLNHPNIIKFYEAFNITNEYGEDFFIIITEYCENGDLFDFLINDEFRNEDEKKEMIIGILKAVQYLHSIGISHGDIKPENILLDSNMNPKLCDFGYANYISNLNKSDNRGTARYMPPEQILGNCLNFIKSDIWSIGITLYVISEKNFPFEYEDEKYAAYQIIHGYMNINPDDKLQYLVSRCIRMNPEERPNITDIFCDEYFEF